MRHCYVLRVFTRDGNGGNHLGVVPDVTGLTRDGMQGIAADLGFSETVFLDWRDGGTPRARIFTPTEELPFAGHPLVGSAWLLTKVGPGGMNRIGCSVGDVMIGNDGDTTWIEPPFDQEVTHSDVDLSSWVDVVSHSTVLMPLPYEIVETSSVERVAAVSPPTSGGAIYLWAWEDPGRAVRARFFARGHGVIEDPATGSAAVALAASLRAIGMSSGDIVIRQGEEMGHPSRIDMTWDGGTVRIGGLVAQDEIRVLEA